MEYMAKVNYENKFKNQLRKQQDKYARMKVEDDKQRKVEMVKKDHQGKVAEEESRKAQKEAEVAQMEMLEMELIRKLQNTQAIQKEAYQDLENALS